MEVRKCPECQSGDIVKNGRSRAGNQRYYCPTCRITFQAEPCPIRVKATLTFEEMKALRDQGLSLAKIGKQAGVSRERVRQIISKQQ